MAANPTTPARLLIEADRVVLVGPDRDARLNGALTLAFFGVGIFSVALQSGAPWWALAAALAGLSSSLLTLRYQLVVTPGQSVLRRRLGPVTWRRRALGPTPQLALWVTFDGDDLMLAASGEEPAEPDAGNCFWIAPGDAVALGPFVARVNAAIAHVAGRGAVAFDLGHVAARPPDSSSSSSEAPGDASPGASG